ANKQLKAQSTQVSGIVTDAQTDETLPGVNILVKGTSTGASTDADGAFQLIMASLQDTIVVSYIGYQTKEVPISGRMELKIALQPQAISGEEVVVVGYGEQSRRKITSSVSSVNMEDVEEIPASSISQTLSGKAAGLKVDLQSA